MGFPTYPEYQQSNFSVAREVPIDWAVHRLKFAVTYNDESLPETTNPEQDIAYVDISSVNLIDGIIAIEKTTFGEAPSRARRIVQDGDTIISTVRTYLKAITSIDSPPENMIVSTGFAVLRPLDHLDKRFIGYVLQNTSFIDEVVANSTGVSYPAINPSTLVCISITYPEDKSNQVKIANFLDWKTGQIDALIVKKKQLIEKLKEKRIALITQAVTKGLNPDATMRDSGIPWIGEIPEHWDIRRLKFTAIESLKYGANESAEGEDIDFPRYIRITDIKENGSLHSDTFRSLLPEVAEPYLLSDGDILLARSGATVGKSFQYSLSWGKAAYAGYLIRFRVDSSVLLPSLAYQFTKSLIYWANIDSTLIQSTIQNFNAEKYGSINIPIPPFEEQKKIVKYIEQSAELIDLLVMKNEQLIDRLSEYRTGLITAATTGKIDVRKVNVGGNA